MSISPRIIISVALQQIDHAPHGKASAQRHDESLQGSNGRSKKLHKSSISPGGKAPAMKKPPFLAAATPLDTVTRGYTKASGSSRSS